MSENIEIIPYFAIHKYKIKTSAGKPSHNPTTMIEATKLRHIYIKM